MKKIIFLAITVLAIFSLSPLTAQADSENYDFSIDHRFRVRGDSLSVEHEVEVNNKVRASLDTVELALPVGSTSGLSAVYSDGTNIPTSTVSKSAAINGVEFAYTGLVLDFPKQIEGTNRSWSFTVEYETDESLHTVGSSHVLIWPHLDGRLDADWRVSLTVPNDWPLVNYSPVIADMGTGDSTVLAFDSGDYEAPLLALSFSEDVVHSLTYRQQLRNRSLWPKTMPVVLPLEMHNQSVSIESLSPRPDKINVDQDGNVVAYYRVWPFQTKSVAVQAISEVRQLRYDPAEAESIADTPSELKPYTQGGRYWTTQGRVGERATSLIDPEASAWANTKHMMDFIQQSVSYDPGVDERIDADAVLESGSGNAENIADLLTTMLRSQGVPARMIYGSSYPSLGLYGDSTHNHVWVEAYIPGLGWVHLDPVWSRLFGGVGSSSFDRVGLLAVSRDTQIELVENLPNDPDLEIAEATELPKADPEADMRLGSYQYILLPGVTLEAVVAENTGSRVIDGVAIGRFDFGSVAPAQSLADWSWRFGGWQDREVLVEAGGVEYQRAVETRWWPMFAIGATVLSIGMLQFYRYKHRRYLRQRLHN